jgi:hypothetical protein
MLAFCQPLTKNAGSVSVSGTDSLIRIRIKCHGSTQHCFPEHTCNDKKNQKRCSDQ